MGALKDFFNHLRPYQPQREIYKVINGCTTTVMSHTSMKSNMSSQIECNILFTAVCKRLAYDSLEDVQPVLSPLYGELLIHIARDGYLKLDKEGTVKFLENRLKLYTAELDKIFEEGSTYYGGIITYLLFIKPLSKEVGVSHDLGKYMEMYPYLMEGANTIDRYLQDTYF